MHFPFSLPYIDFCLSIKGTTKIQDHRWLLLDSQLYIATTNTHFLSQFHCHLWDILYYMFSLPGLFLNDQAFWFSFLTASMEGFWLMKLGCKTIIFFAWYILQLTPKVFVIKSVFVSLCIRHLYSSWFEHTFFFSFADPAMT